MKALGIILIIAGAAMFFVNGLDFTTKEKVIDAGPIQVSADKEKSIEWPAYAGGVVMMAGVVLLFVSKKKK
ncbi:hypothetical protein [Algoriphagus confluentis]|uniref:LPXTG cell wall anchor domain-containing protein n=1 Tax=Algoriphagus confluentis TaxID=1697556 RepID=A0ABQ6PID9_9BACT|nr:hypothetical protein Aconfl_03310 [Algoriphagus confluentis]